jgi:plastocyanin
MKLLSIACLLAVGVAAASCRKTQDLDDPPTVTPVARGGARGHVRVTGAVPPNDVIRMNADPMCSKATDAARVTNDAVMAASDGSLANVLVELVGGFSDTPVPTEPVSIDQRGCLYLPRVVGVRAGQALQVRNSDDGLHNVHGQATDRDSFNVSQPMRGMVNTFRPRDTGILRLKCDVHTWMVAFVAVVNHPYFAVTGADGAFDIRDIPEGTYDVRAWHEQLGTLASRVNIVSSRAASVDFTYAVKAAPTP